MGINKVVYGNTTLIDISADTVVSSVLAQGYTAHDAAGQAIVGTATPGSVVITEEPDSHGGTVKVITTDGSIDLSQDTVDAAHLLVGYTAHNSSGQAVTGAYVAPANGDNMTFGSS